MKRRPARSATTRASCQSFGDAMSVSITIRIPSDPTRSIPTSPEIDHHQSKSQGGEIETRAAHQIMAPPSEFATRQSRSPASEAA
jgi:hypothetical protein